MRKTLITAFLIAAGSVIGCSGTSVPRSAAHFVAGEASFVPVLADNSDDHQQGNVPPPGPAGCGDGTCNGQLHRVAQ
jgi:hypothetical protein